MFLARDGSVAEECALMGAVVAVVLATCVGVESAGEPTLPCDAGVCVCMRRTV